MPREAMTPRERWLAVLSHRKPDRVPMDYWGTDELTAKLLEYLGCSSRREALQKLHVDYVVTVGPRYVGPPLPERTDPFGCRYQDVSYGNGVYAEVVHHPLAGFSTVAEIERHYTWPSPDWWDYAGIRDQLAGNEGYPIQGGYSEPLYIYTKMRGQEQAFMDMVENPELLHYCLDKLFELAYVDAQRIYEQIPGEVLLTYVAEDVGGQTDLMFSPQYLHEFLLPGMKRMIDLAHQAGAFVFHHNDGNIRRIIPDLIEAGIDILNPVQWRCPNMEREGLKRDFGDRLVFHGAMDNQYTLPFGTVAEVRQEVEDNIRILGKDGGYILAPCNFSQSIGPAKNVVAMYEAGYELGWM